MKKIKRYRWILVIVLLLWGIYIGLSKRSEHKWINIPIITKHNKIKECKTRLLWIMKSPTTAKFSDIAYKVNKSKLNTWDYIYQESWVKMVVKSQSWMLFWTYTDWSWEISTWQVKVLSWWYIKTQLKLAEDMTANENRRQEITDSIYSIYTTNELEKVKKEFSDLSYNRMALFMSHSAIGVVIKWTNDIIIRWNTDSQNSYWAMVRSKFHCEKVDNEEMFWELLE